MTMILKRLFGIEDMIIMLCGFSDHMGLLEVFSSFRVALNSSGREEVAYLIFNEKSMQHDFELPKLKRRSNAWSRWQKRYLTKAIRLLAWLNLLVLLLCILIYAAVIGLSKLGVSSIAIDADKSQLMAFLALGAIYMIARPRKRKKYSGGYSVK